MSNWYKQASTVKVENPNYKKTHMFNVPFRAVVAGSSGSGKTNTVLDIISKMPNTFQKIVVCTKDSNEPLYDLLKDKLKDQLSIYDGMISKKMLRGGNKMIPNVPSLDDVAEKDDKGFIPKLIIFDDLCLDDNETIGQYFIRARKKNISCIYITQAWYSCPRIIRLQANYAVLKRGANIKDLRSILRETSLPQSIGELTKLYNDATDTFESFFLIDLFNNKCYNTFSTTPISGGGVSGGGGVGDTDDIYTPNEEKYDYDMGHIKHKYTKREAERYGLQLFIEALQHSDIKGCILNTDLYASYEQFCSTNNLTRGTKSLMGRELSKIFPRINKGNRVLFEIN